MKHRNFVDKYGYMLEWSRGEGDNGKGDAVARTVIAAIIYRKNKVFDDAIWNSFWHFIHGGLWRPIRHIETPRTEDFSRDHTIWFIIWLCYFGDPQIALRIPWKISEKFKQTLDMWLWIRAITKDRWIDRFAYWAVASVVMRFNNRLNRFLRWRAGITSISYKVFKVTPKDQLTKKELFARKHSAPGYIMDTQAFMIHCLSDGWFKNRLKKRMIPLVEWNNWLIRKLMDDEISWPEEYEMDNYTGMDGWRCGRRMDKTTSIEMNALSGIQPEYNMDVDVLHANLEIL